MSAAMELQPAPGMLGMRPMPRGQSAGLLGETSRLMPGPAFTKPERNVMHASLQLVERDAAEAAAAMLQDQIPDELEAYKAGLQPYIAPAGTPWVEEVIFDRVALTDTQIEAQMLAYFDQAKGYDRQLQDDRILASQYYAGMPFGDEEVGRSQLVLTTVRDTIRATMPSLLRIFTGVENPVEFRPLAADNEQLGLLHAQLARQATAYAHWALFVANDGWIVLHDCILDALTRRVGWCRWYWGQQRMSRVEQCDSLLLPQLQLLLQGPGITAQRIVRRPMRPSEIRAVATTPEGQAYFQAGGPAVFYACNLTRVVARGWPVVEYVPAECVWIVPDADRPGTARAIFHVRDLPASDLISAGLPDDEVLGAASEAVNPQRRREAVARDQISGDAMKGMSSPHDPSMRMVRYTEGWIRVDTDGDNIAELIHVHGVGERPRLIRWDRTDEVPLSGFTPYREPGRVIGFSQADMCMDLQKTESRVMRGILDSLGQSLYPRTVATLNQCVMEDVRQTAIGSIIRVTQQGAVTELTKPYIGDKALGILDSLEAVRESRTGITRTSQGMTAEALQSTTPSAVSAQTSAASDRIDMIARTLCETGLVPLYEGLLRMMARQQDRPNVLSIRGSWMQIDPRALSIMWAVQCNVGHAGTKQEQLAMLSAIAAKQEQILAPAVAQGMLDTPLVGLPEYRNTLARIVEVAGFSDTVSYFKALPPDWQPPPPPNKPTTEEVLAQVEQEKTRLNSIDQARSDQTDRLKVLLDNERSRDEAAVQAWVQLYGIAAQHGTPMPAMEEIQNYLRSEIAMDAGEPDNGELAGPQPAGPFAGGVSPSQAPSGGGGGVQPGDPRFGRVNSLPITTPPIATPQGATGAIDPATVQTMRQAILNRQGLANISRSLLMNRATGAR